MGNRGTVSQELELPVSKTSCDGDETTGKQSEQQCSTPFLGVESGRRSAELSPEVQKAVEEALTLVMDFGTLISAVDLMAVICM